MNLVKKYKEIESPDNFWYFSANLFATSLAFRYNKPLPVVCGVISSLSPATNWEQNKKDAEILLSINAGIYKGKHKFVTYGQNVIKAQKILIGEIEPEKAFSVKTGAKTYNFFHNILNPTGDHVTIDRHAYTIATGEKYITGIGLKKYRLIADQYKKAAKKLGILPSMLQCALWVNHRIEKNISYNVNMPF